MSESNERYGATPSGPGERDAAAQRRERGGGGGSIDPDAWMVTFSDLLTLLMTFFVLIFASQDPAEQAIREAFGQSRGVFGLFRRSFLEEVVVVPRRDISQQRLQVFLDEIGAVEIAVEQTERGLLVHLPTDALFAPGSARLTEEALERVGQLAEYLRLTEHRIRVEGHTDNSERPGPYGGRWALSVARAHAVLQQMLRHNIAPARLSLIGYGPSRPLYDNASRLGRARNRRVDLVIRNRPGES